jgi:hypothetical protein
VFLLFAMTSAPAKAQMGGFSAGGGEEMMTQMAPMLEMMKAKMGKRRFAMLMQTMGPMMSRMMEGGDGFGGMSGMMGGGDVTGMMGGYGGMIPGGYGGGDIMSMIGPMMRLANSGGGHGRRRRPHS